MITYLRDIILRKRTAWTFKSLGAYAAWDMSAAITLPTGGIVVPNVMSSIPISTNLFRGSRRLLNNTVYFTNVGATGADTVDEGIDTSTLNGTGNWYKRSVSTHTLPAGTYTVAGNVKRNTDSDQVFAFSGNNGVVRSAAKTATATRNRESYTFTLASPAAINTVLFCSTDGTTAADVQLTDFELYPGSADLGPMQYDGHLYVGQSAFDTRPSIAAGVLDLSTGAWGLIQFESSKTVTQFTAMCLMSKVSAGSLYQSFLSKVQAYTEFSAMIEQNGIPRAYVGGDRQFDDGSGLFILLNAGYHAITLRYDGTKLSLWVDDVKLYQLAATISAQSFQDLFHGITNTASLPTGCKIASMALWDRALTDAELRNAYSKIAAWTTKRTGQAVNFVSRILVAEGDSITAASTCYPFKFGPNASPSVIGVNMAVASSQMSHLNSRLPTVLEIAQAARAGRKIIVTVLQGRNDILNYATAQDFCDALWAYTDQLRAAGCIVCIGTLLPSTAVGFNDRRNQVNPIISAAEGVRYDRKIDFAADPVIGPDAAAADTSLYGDGTHPTATMQQNNMEPIYRAVVNSI